MKNQGESAMGLLRSGVLCLMAALAMAGAGIANAANVAVTLYADDGYPPYSYLDQGKPAGLYHDIIRAALAHVEGYDVEIKPVPWKRGMELLRSGKGFALYPPYKNTKDEPWTWPYSEPLLDEHVVAYCNPKVLKKKTVLHWPEDFYGLRVGNNAGFIVGGEAFDQAVKDGKIIMQEARDSLANIRKLRLGRIDCYINDRQAILWTLKALRQKGSPDAPLREKELVEAVAISVKQGYLGYTDRDQGAFAYKADFVKQFDAAILQMKRNGDIERIVAAFMRQH
jgi:polar amino acid transport system substrate-binding protein